MPDDHSANILTSGVVAVGGTAVGNIETGGDQDWFAVELVAGRTYTIDLRGNGTGDGTLGDPYLHGIHDGEGNLISGITNNNGGAGYNSRVTLGVPKSRGQLQNCAGDGIRSAWLFRKNPCASFS